MDVQAVVGKITEQMVDTALIYLMEGGPGDYPGNATRMIDGAMFGALLELIDNGEFTGKDGEVLVLYPRGAIPARRVIIVGIGSAEDFSVDIARRAAARGLQRARELNAEHVATVPLGTGRGGLDVLTSAQAITEGALLGAYQYHGQKSSEAPADLPKRLDILAYDEADLPATQQGIKTGTAYAAGTLLARDLVNLPPNICNPAYLAQRAAQMAQEVGLRVEVLEEQQMRALKMGALLAVAQGSSDRPRFIIMEHNAAKAGDGNTVVLVGKGVTFDTGGYSLKTRDGMVGMKADMGGAAAVIGAMKTVALLDLPLHVVGLVPSSDNMVSGAAYRPQDVVTASNGKTIEIISTDAEGRMLLADALVYAGRYRPAAVIDIATLTGACVTALGTAAAGLFSNNDGLRDALLQAAADTFERVWPLPIFSEHVKEIESQTADMKNVGGKYGGASTAAAFLQNFADYPAWAHVDMAGVAGIEGTDARHDNPYISKGGTGFGARLLARFAANHAAQTTSSS